MKKLSLKYLKWLVSHLANYHERDAKFDTDDHGKGVFHQRAVKRYVASDGKICCENQLNAVGNDLDEIALPCCLIHGWECGLHLWESD